MAFRHTIDPKAQVIFAVATGTISPGEALEMCGVIQADPAFSPSLNVLLDLRGARVVWDHAALRRMGECRPFARRSRRAIVVPDDLHYGLGRVYGALADPAGGESLPFRTLEDACAWIGVPVPAADAALRPLIRGCTTADSQTGT